MGGRAGASAPSSELLEGPASMLPAAQKPKGTSEWL